jgi:hypothetical protein
MSKIVKFSDFIEHRDYFSNVDESIVNQINENYQSHLNEGLLDSILNKVEKSVFGDFSKVGIIDKIRNGNLEIQKEIAEKRYDHRDELDALEIKEDEVRKANNKAALLSIQNEKDRKKEQFRTFFKMKKTQMEKGLDLLEKVIDKNQRRKDYYKAGLAEDEAELAKFEYELARRKSDDSNEIEKLRSSFENARKEAEEIVNKFQKQVTPNAPDYTTISDDRDLINPQKLKSKILTKNPKAILDLKKMSEKSLSKKSQELKNSLASFAKMIEDNKKKGLGIKSSTVSKEEKKNLKIANQLDAFNELINIYSNLGNSANEIKNKISKDIEVKNLVNNVNDTISKAKKGDLNFSRDLFVAFSDPVLDEKKFKDIIKKIK